MSSHPSFENIDQWLFEYVEGNLSANQETHLMNFLNEHPELMEELKMWQDTKVTSRNIPTMETTGLIKESFVSTHSRLLVVLGLLFLLSGWYILHSFLTTERYSQTNSDTKIIRVDGKGTPSHFITVANYFDDAPEEVEKNNNINEKTNSNNLNSIATNISIGTNSNTDFELLHDPKNLAVTTLKNDAINPRLDNKNNPSQLSLVATTTPPLIEEDIEEEFMGFAIQNSLKNTLANKKTFSHVKAEELESVVAYLNNDHFLSSRFSKAKTNHADIARSEGASSLRTKASSNGKNIKTTVSLSRRIRRMLDQPTALRSTKNPYYQVPMMSGFNANPAMVGASMGNRIQNTTRVQWPIASYFQLMNSLAWDNYIQGFKGGVGVQIDYNSIGLNSLMDFSAKVIYSPKFNINRYITIEPALSFKLGNTYLDKNSSIIGNSVEFTRGNTIPLFTDNQEVLGNQLWYKDVGIGFMVNTRWFYSGFNIDNIARHYNNFYSSDLTQSHRDNLYYTAIIGTEYAPLNYNFKLSGYAFYQNYNKLNEFWLGSNFQYKWFQVGVAASHNLNIAGSLGFFFKRGSIHYNIDYSQSQLYSKRLLSHQLTFEILIRSKYTPSKLLTP